MIDFNSYTDGDYDVTELLHDDEIVIGYRIRHGVDLEDIAHVVIGDLLEDEGGTVSLGGQTTYDPDLLDLTGIGAVTAERLAYRGIYTRADLKTAFENDDSAIEVISSQWVDTIETELGE